MAAIGVRPGRELTRGKMADRPGVQPRAPCIHTASVNVIVTTDDVIDVDDTLTVCEFECRTVLHTSG